MHWGSDATWGRLDYPIHSVVNMFQLRILLRLIDPRVIQRMLDLDRKVAKDSDFFSAGELFEFLDTTIFSELKSDPLPLDPKRRNFYVSGFRRGLQRQYVIYLSAIHSGVSSDWSTEVRALARRSLSAIRDRVQSRLKKRGSMDLISQAHLEDLLARTTKSLTGVRTLHGY